jgi:hypothetical protein
VRILIHPVTLLLATIEAQRAALGRVLAGEPATTATIATARAVVGADAAIAFHARHRPTL